MMEHSEALKILSAAPAGVAPICPCGCKSSNNPEDIQRLILEGIPDYALEAYEKHGTSQIETERRIIRSEKYIREPLYHHMRHTMLLMPWLVHDPNLVRLTRDDIRCEDMGRRIHNMIGHASSGKTNFTVVYSMRMLDLWPEDTQVFVASPFLNASDYLLWEQFDQAVDLMKEYKTADLHKTKNCITLNQKKKAGPGTIRLIAIDKVSVLRGKKMRNDEVGRLAVVMDEAGEFPNDSILRIVANLISQQGFRMKTGTNFTDILGLDGKLNTPEDMKWTDLDRDIDYEWKGIRNSFTTRLRAMTCSNVLLGEDYYPYMMRNRAHDELLKFGKDSPDYLCQADAFPSIHTSNRLILTDRDLDGTQTFEKANFEQDTEDFFYLDPSFTEGGDACYGTHLRFGYENGRAAIEAIAKVQFKISDSSTWNTQTVGLAKQLRGQSAMTKKIINGDLMSPYDMCAIETAKYCMEHGIMFHNVGFDDSMNGDLALAMTYFLTEEVNSFYYGGKADKHVAFPTKMITRKVGGEVKLEPATNSELYTKKVSQNWFTAVAIIKSNYLRNGGVVLEAIEDLKSRLRGDLKGGKIDIESKADYKQRTRGGSPDAGDSFCGGVCLIVQKRMSPQMNAPEDSSIEQAKTVFKTIADSLASSNFSRPRRFKRTSR